MKILLSAYACHPHKGSEHGVGWSWVKELSQDHEVSLFTRTKNTAAIADALSGLRQGSVDILPVDLHPSLRFLGRFKQTKGLYYFLWQLAALIKARPLVRTQRIELAHHVTFMSATRWCFVGWLGIKSVVGPVGGLQTWPLGARGLVERPWRECLRDLSIRFLAFNPFFLLGPARADVLILANNSNVGLLPERVRAKTILGMQVGCGLLPIKSPRRRRHEARVNIQWSGRMEDHKGFPLLVSAVACLKQRSSPALANLRVTVTTTAEKTASCVSRISVAGVSEYFEVIGWLTPDEYEDLWDSTDIFVFTSLRETTGMALIEAMIRGIPPVVFANGGPAEIVAAGCGIKLECASLSAMVSGLANALELLVSDPSLRDRLGRAAAAHAVREFDWKNVGNRMQKIYGGFPMPNKSLGEHKAIDFSREKSAESV